jgi:hypothetical protein
MSRNLACVICADFLGDLHQGANLAERRKSKSQRFTARHRSHGEEGQLKKPYPKPEDVIDHDYLLEVTGR